jgi:thymidylate synthase ThyX
MTSKAILFSYTNYPELTTNLEEAGVKMSKDSMLRHGSFTFDLQGISRAASHQIVRHRIASFSQQSQRYVKVTRSYGYLKPPGVPEDLRVKLRKALSPKASRQRTADTSGRTRQPQTSS